MRVGLRGSCENQGLFVGHRLPSQSNQQRDTNETLTVYDIQVKGSIVPFATWAGQGKFVFAPSLHMVYFGESIDECVQRTVA